MVTRAPKAHRRSRSGRVPRARLALVGLAMLSAGLCGRPTAARAQVLKAIRNDDICVFQIMVTRQAYSSHQPWQKETPSTHYGYGVYVGNGRILTTEHLVRNSTLLELRRAQRGEKVRARVLISDPHVNLALLEVEEPPFDWPRIAPAFATEHQPGQALSILQFNETRQLQRGEAQLLQASVSNLPRSNSSSLSFKLLTDLNVDGEGAPVLADDRLAGLMITYDESTRTGFMVPYPVLARFLRDADKEPYTGFAVAGFMWRPLVDPVKRAYYGAPRLPQGVQVLRCLPESGASQVLRPEDVILELDGYPIDNLGFYEDPDFDRLAFTYIVKGRHVPGDVIPVKLIRKGRVETVDMSLTRMNDYRALIPDNFIGQRPEYLVSGGMIIRELSARYLVSYGAKWRRAVNPRLAQFHLTRHLIPSSPGDHLVILAKVLPHPINVAYQIFDNRVITHINDQPVRNMDDVFRIVDTDGGLNRVRLHSVDLDLVLDEKELKAADAQIIRDYGIPQLRYRRRDDITRLKPDLSKKKTVTVEDES